MLRGLSALGLAVLCGLVIGAPSFAAGKDFTTTRCTETLAPGVYQRVVVPANAVCIISETGLKIRGGGLWVEPGATFIFGDETTPDVNAEISGGVHSQNAGSVQIHFSRINGGVNLQGGSGPDGGPFDFGDGFRPTWNTLEDNTINGNVKIEGYNGFWQGFLRNVVNGNVNFNNNVVADPDGNEVQTNTINGNLNCVGNTPAPQQGDSEGAPNVVSGHKTGQCEGV
jgi:hypothetical protein